MISKGIIESFVKGEKMGFDQIYDAYSPGMFIISLRYTRCSDDAQDILQETFKVRSQDAGLPKSTFSQFGFSALIRPEIQYSFNHFGIGMYGEFTYDFKHGVNWESIKRQRCSVGGGFLIRYKL